MKKLFLILIGIFLLSGCTKVNQPLSAGMILDQKIAVRISEIQAVEEIDKQPNGKYKQRPLTVADGVEYKIDEYETAKGETGYIVRMKKEDATGIYQKVIAVGVLQKDFEQDWLLISNKIATSTPIK